MATAANLSLGPGILRFAPLGTAVPTDLATAWPTGWEEIGYTEEGSQFSYEIASDPVEAAEALEPLFYEPTGRNGNVAFAMLENTARNMTLAFNGGTVTKTGTAPNEIITFEPPALGAEVRRMLGWESKDGTERWIYFQCFQGGSVTVARRKGADKATIPVEFRLEKPDVDATHNPNGSPFRIIYAASRNGGAVA